MQASQFIDPVWLFAIIETDDQDVPRGRCPDGRGSGWKGKRHMSRIRFGLILPENPLKPPDRTHYLEDVHRLLTLAKGHYDSAWCIDHLDGDVLEGWTNVSYLSALHPELVWGHAVLSQPFRNPALLAKMSATLSFLTGGRYVLGIGAGGDERDHLTYGYDFPSGRERVAQLDEALTIIRSMWTEERVTFEGTYHQVNDARCEPRPDPLPPVMIGAFRPMMLRLTARHADWWNVSSTDIETYLRLVDDFERACDEVGRDPATVRRVWSGGCVCAPTEAEARDLATHRGSGHVVYEPGEDFAGTPAQVIEQMRPFIDLGVDTFLLDCGGFPRLTTVEMLIDQVLPALNR
jgi:alkanesulfonate monooxygenase SsuD/methylene tetrahydromethanopterin reductase-like flavin-dependent oxidoreductase (luciferase family)